MADLGRGAKGLAALGILAAGVAAGALEAAVVGGTRPEVEQPQVVLGAPVRGRPGAQADVGTQAVGGLDARQVALLAGGELTELSALRPAFLAEDLKAGEIDPKRPMRGGD